MTTALLIAAVVAAGAFCPLMMWIQGRRGRSAACCVPGPDRDSAVTRDDLRRRRAEVDALIRRSDAHEAAARVRPGS